MNKSLLFLSTNTAVPWGGSEVLWSWAASRLVKKGDKVQVYVKKWEPRPKHIQGLIEEGCKVTEWGWTDYILPMPQRLMNRILPTKFRFGAKTPPFSKYLSDNPIDYAIVSVGDHNEGVEWTKVFIEKSIPYCIVVQLAKDANWPPDGEEARRIREAYQKAHKVYFVSHDNQKLVERQCAVTFSNAEVIFNPYNVKFPQPLPYPNTTKGFSLAFMASLSSNHKGQDLLFEVLNMKKWKERDLYVNLYGKGPHKEGLEQLKKHWQLDKVAFKGFVDNVEAVWAENHALILCSRMEGQSLALQEAMMCGRMPIVTNVGGANELIDDGINGFIAKAPTVELIDENLERAWQKRNEWETMGSLAFEKANKVIPSDPVGYFIERL